MTLFVIDPGCMRVTSHHFAMNEAIERLAAAAQETARTLFNAEAEAAVSDGLAGDGVFASHMVYARTDDEMALIAEHDRQAPQFAAELETHVSPRLSAGDRILIHSIDSSLLLGLALWLRKTRPSGIAVRIVLGFPPEFRLAPVQASLSAALYAYALQLCAGAPGADVRLFAYGRQLTERFHTLTGLAVEQTPVPVDFRLFGRHAPQQRPEGQIAFGYFGEARAEKGVQLLGDAFLRVAAALPGAHFLVQAVRIDPRAIPWAQALEGRISWLPGAVSIEDYYKILSMCDVLLLPYDPAEYRLRPSKIFSESLGFEKPVVTTAGTWMAEELARLPAPPGVAMATADADALADAMLRIAADYPAFRSAAAAAGPAWRAQHDVAAFVRQVLA